MSENNKTTVPEGKYIGMAQLAQLWGCHRNTLSRHIQRLRDQIPNYIPKQKMFAPAQYKKLAELLGFDI